MKILTAFILILAWGLNKCLACGPYYPEGEGIRYSILSPDIFDLTDFTPFHYSADLFYNKYFDDTQLRKSGRKSNTIEWKKRYKNKVQEKDIYQFVYENPTKNKFKSFLEKNDTAALSYLLFAKNTSILNNLHLEDPWERNDKNVNNIREAQISKSLINAKNTSDKDLKKRYAFLAIRLCFYNEKFDLLKSTYEHFFNAQPESTIDYWSLSFYNYTLTDKVHRYYYAAKVFANTPSKRIVSYQQYNKETPVSEVLKLARNEQEKGQIILLSELRNPGRSLKNIEKIYNTDPKCYGLPFLLLREVNKIEDWILTPYYTNMGPSINPVSPVGKNLSSDRIYSKNLLSFLQSVDLKKVNNPLLWKVCKAHINFINQNYETSLNELSSIKHKHTLSSSLLKKINFIEALCLTANQKNGEATLDEKVLKLVYSIRSASEDRLIFSLGRELEYNGNTTEAALLFSHINKKYSYDEDYLYWDSKKGIDFFYTNSYDDYFFYMDADYSIKQIQDLIQTVSGFNKVQKEYNWLYSVAAKDLPRLYDLLGTKYMRKNDLKEALQAFKNVNDTLWVSENFPYKTFLNANPFYTNFYTEHSKTSADTISFNKESIVEKLIHHLNLAKNLNIPNQEYHYFLAANCYFNMTHFGNSWMMKRYYWSSRDYTQGFPDDDDYSKCLMAKKYYLKAKSVSKTLKFSALCLRMAGRCEKYRLLHSNEEWPKPYLKKEDTTTAFSRNIYYFRLKSKFPNDYETLINNCTAFEDYFNSLNM